MQSLTYDAVDLHEEPVVVSAGTVAPPLARLGIRLPSLRSVGGDGVRTR